MPVNCSVCSAVCKSDDTQVKCAENCGAVCHRNCAPVKTRGAKKEWACEACREKESGSQASSKSTTPTTISKEFLVNTIEAFKKEMLSEMKKITKENADMSTSLGFLNKTIEENNTKLEGVMRELKKTQEDSQRLLKENAELRNTVTGLEVRVRNLEQYSRKQNIEIDGIPESREEDISAVLEDVAKAIGIDLRSEKVVAAHRVPTFNKRRTPPIVVRFATYEEKDAWIKGFKNVRPLTANKIHPSFSASDKVFVNEHLSPENKLLLSKTKEAARAKNYKFVWSRDGKIFVRQSEGEKCKKIDTVFDLDKL